MTGWREWAPPLSPPAEPGDGLDAEQAQAIADRWWACEPHLAAALMWEAYAATLPPAPSVTSVSTGAQSVVYSPAVPGGPVGAALARAAWHRSFIEGRLESVPLRVAEVDAGRKGPPSPWWWDP